MSEETKVHPAKRMGELIYKRLYYFNQSTLADMLGVSKIDIDNFCVGVHEAFSEDQIFIIPYLVNLRHDLKKEYAALHEECKKWPKLELSDIYSDNDFDISIRLKSNYYRQFELSPSQYKQMVRILLGKKKTEDIEQQELTV